jgi:hypothetical protein
MIKTFRGLLLDGGQDKIRLSTKKGKIGYRIVKFQIMPNTPGGADYESVTQIWKVAQSTVTATVDFSDGNLLGVAFWSGRGGGAAAYPDELNVVFDQEIFNQDIYITQQCLQDGDVNYYLELETINLSDNAAIVSTLRDIRLNPQVGA